jgi:methionyl-tRNA formyltransferase
MKILFLGGNLSKEIAEWLIKQGEDVTYTEKKIDFDFILQVKSEMIISYNYRYIISKDIIEFVNGRAINLHISCLPWNKGAYPNIWSFLEDTPKGVTIHIIDEGIDTGSILIQKEVYIDENTETLRSFYEKLHREIQKLFKRNWNDIKNEKLKLRPQDSKGSMHYVKDFKKIEHLISDKGWDIPIKEFKNRYKNLIGV